MRARQIDGPVLFFIAARTAHPSTQERSQSCAHIRALAVVLLPDGSVRRVVFHQRVKRVHQPFDAAFAADRLERCVTQPELSVYLDSCSWCAHSPGTNVCKWILGHYITDAG